MLVLAALALIPIGGTVFLITSSSTTRAGSTDIPEKVGSAGSNERSESSGAPKDVKTPPASAVVDQPIAPYQAELLDIAFDAATKFPVQPHLVTRSMTQEAIADTCFELDQPRRALAYIEKIEDWRRGKGYADYAFYCAQHGAAPEVPHWLEQAHKVAEHWTKEPDSQYWHIDRIKASMAKAQLALGDLEAAARLEAGTAEFEAEKVEVLKASMLTQDSFDHELELIDAAIAKGNFDMTKSALESAAQLFKKFYEDVDRRSLVEMKIKASWSKLPLQIRIELMIEMIESALAHQDRDKALALLGESRTLMESALWLPEDRIGLLAKLAALRDHSGDRTAAREEAAEALATFDADREKIQNFNRAKALRPVAEAYQSMDDPQASLDLYRRVIEAGGENPNARPRAQDLCATCCSMALHGIEPDAALHARILELRDGLADPW